MAGVEGEGRRGEKKDLVYHRRKGGGRGCGGGDTRVRRKQRSLI